MESSESSLEQLAQQLADAQAALKEAEGQAKSSLEAAQEKDSMIKYVELEVDRVEGEAGGGGQGGEGETGGGGRGEREELTGCREE